MGQPEEETGRPERISAEEERMSRLDKTRQLRNMELQRVMRIETLSYFIVLFIRFIKGPCLLQQLPVER